MTDTYCLHCMQKKSAEESVCPHCHASAGYQAPVHHIKPGTILKEKYLIGRALGEGGFGITYIGRDLTLDMRIAVKEFFPSGYSHRNHNYTNEVTLTQNTDGNDFETEMRRFLNEARTLARFSDEQGIVGVRDFFQENGTAYIVMEYLDGITMKTYIQRFGTIPADKLFAMMDPVLVSLGRIHREGLIHRDISPDNIFVLKNGRLKLLDFGAARDFTGDKSLSVVLKPGYAPEEQYRTKGNQGPWTDVYAICATMYKCVTGITPDESLERVYEDSLKPPSKLGISIPPAQEAALMQGLQVKAKDRTQDVETLQKNLRVSDDTSATRNLHIERRVENSEADSINGNNEKTVYQSAGTAQTVSSANPVEDVKTVYQPTPSPVDSQADKKQSPLEKPQHKASANRQLTQGRAKAANEKQPAPGSHKRQGRKAIVPIIGIAAAVLIIVISVSVFCLGGLKEQISKVPGRDFYSLESVGKLSDASRSLNVSGNVLSLKAEENQTGFHLLNYRGEDSTNEIYSRTTYLGYGLYAAAKASNDVNSVALITVSGEILIPPEACLIEWPYQQDEGNCRYVVVYYATEQATSDKDFLICVTENGSVYTSDVGGTLYTGYIKIFDLAQKQFVGNLRFECPSRCVQICGSNIVVGESTSTGYTLFDPNGNVLLQTKDIVYVGDGTLVIYSSGTYRVYDESGNQTYSANNGITLIGHSQYIKMKSGDLYLAMDRNGNTVLQKTYGNIIDERNGIFIVEHNGKKGLVTIDDTELLPCQYDYITNVYRVNEIGCVFYYAEYGNHYTLLCPDGIVMKNLSSRNSRLIQFQNTKALVINNRSFDLDLGSTRYEELTIALISVRAQSNGLYGVYDLFTGQQLLPSEYETIQYAAGYLYAFKNGNWEIYEVRHSTDI